MPEQIPKTPAEIADLAKDVYEKLISKYVDKGEQFVDNDQKQTGLIFRCAGSVALLLLANTFEEIGVDNKWRKIIYRELDLVYKHIEEKGYDATPYVTDENTEKLFSKSTDYNYTDSLSWVLSMTTLIRVASHRLKRFKDETPPAAFLSRTHELMKDALTKIRDAACPTGGWNFSNGCAEPHLYYSFAVSEALADFGDYVLGETPEIFNVEKEKDAEDKELRKELGGTLIEEINATRKKLLEYLYHTYLPQLGQNEIEHLGLPLMPTEKRHILLYYSYFVLEMLVTCKLDPFYPQWEDELNEALENGIYLSRIDLSRAMKDKIVEKEGEDPWFENADKSTLWIRDWFSFKEPHLIPPASKRTIGEPSLIPLSVRCNAQYAYWVADGPDAKMPKLFGFLLDNRNPNDGLWDAEGYNLLITERAVEAIVDYFDYVIKYESRHQSSSTSPHGESVLDRSLHEVIKVTVKDFFESDDGRALLPQAMGVLPGSSQEPLDARMQLTRLATALAHANRSRKEGDKSELKKEVGDLDQAFTVMLDYLVYEWLSTRLKNQPDKLKMLRKGVDMSKDAIAESVGRSLAATPDINGKSLVSVAVDYLIETATKDFQLKNPTKSD